MLDHGAEYGALQAPCNESRRVSVAQLSREKSLGHQAHVASFLIANPRLETRLTQRKQTVATPSNREFLQICISSLRSIVTHHLPRGTAFLIDRAYQLEIDVTPCKQRPAANSNRRWIAILQYSKIPLCKLLPSLRSKDDATKEASA